MPDYYLFDLKSLGMIFIILGICVIALSCGQGSETVYQAQPPADPAFAKIAPIIQTDCSQCHNGTQEPAFTSGAVFKASQAKAFLTNGTMPPTGQISTADKTALLNYLN